MRSKKAIQVKKIISHNFLAPKEVSSSYPRAHSKHFCLIFLHFFDRGIFFKEQCRMDVALYICIYTVECLHCLFIHFKITIIINVKGERFVAWNSYNTISMGIYNESECELTCELISYFLSKHTYRFQLGENPNSSYYT